MLVKETEKFGEKSRRKLKNNRMKSNKNGAAGAPKMNRIE